MYKRGSCCYACPAVSASSNCEPKQTLPEVRPTVKRETGNPSAWLLEVGPPSLTLGQKPEARAGRWAGRPEVLRFSPERSAPPAIHPGYILLVCLLPSSSRGGTPSTLHQGGPESSRVTRWWPASDSRAGIIGACLSLHGSVLGPKG